MLNDSLKQHFNANQCFIALHFHELKIFSMDENITNTLTKPSSMKKALSPSGLEKKEGS